MTSVNWTLANGYYQVSSAQHLLCIASLGNGFTTTGTPPASQAAYGSSNYIQVNDVDCAGFTMVPIGNYGSYPYTGTYNGQNFQILNWQNNQSNSTGNQGIFGTSSAELKNIVIAGTIKVQGGSNCAALVGNYSGGGIRNITINFATGSVINGQSSTAGMIGSTTFNSSYNNLRVSGVVSITGTSQVGGVFGHAQYNGITDVTQSITGNITGTDTVGGIVAYAPNSTMTACINAMTGNILCNGNTVGGIGGTSGTYNTCLNTMTGDITGNSYVGGICGNGGNFTDVINIMKGNVVSTVSSTYSGGVGYGGGFTRCVVATAGNVPYLLMNDTLSPSASNCVYSNKFGMTVNGASKAIDST